MDFREILVFWEIMKTFEELSGQKKFQVPIFMQHPILEERERSTVQMIPTAMELRRKAKVFISLDNCPEAQYAI